jgi:hypothetical protein
LRKFADGFDIKILYQNLGDFSERKNRLARVLLDLFILFAQEGTEPHILEIGGVVSINLLLFSWTLKEKAQKVVCTCRVLGDTQMTMLA